MKVQPAPINVNEDIIGSATSIEGFIDALARRGCSDLTSSIDLSACSDRPYAGGGFCDVYRGALHSGTRIAIKSLRIYERSQLERDREGRKILKSAAREIYHWSKLKHENVLSLMGLAVFKGYIAMVSEWIENGDLTSYLKQKPGADRIRLCKDVCAGLCYIHSRGMVHGDLKGANIMVSRDGIAMITDFGNSQLKNLTLKFSNSGNSAVSIRWAAPELLEAGDPQVSMEADVYAYGMTVLETLSGKVPYHGVSDTQALALIVIKNKVPPRPDLEISDDMWDLLTCCWARTPSKRPKIASVRDRLGALVPPSLIESIVGALVKRGCADLTSTVDWSSRSDRPYVGGGLYDVYRGLLYDGTRIAFKSLRVYGSSQPGGGSERQKKVLNSAAREIYHWSKLKHRNVVPLMGFAVFEESISMVSGWMENGDLTSYLEQKPNADRTRLCLDICAGVCYMHESGMVHGGLRGANIMISSNGVAMIAGFGNARLDDPTLEFADTTNRSLSIRWAAPELFVDSRPQVSMEADVYAYGMTVLEALTGRVPFEGVSNTQVLILVVVKKTVPPRPDSGMPDGLWELANSCWARAPSERPKITDVRNRLEALVAPSLVPAEEPKDAGGGGQVETLIAPSVAPPELSEDTSSSRAETRVAAAQRPKVASINDRLKALFRFPSPKRTGFET